LPPGSLRFFERRLGVDLSGVRVHHDGGAARLAASVNARAFTVGRDVFFGAGEWAPGTARGDRLLAHELTHTVQQRGHSDDVLQRAPDETLTPEIVVQDPGLLLCAALCYIGLPPSIFRELFELFLKAAWEEYRSEYGQLAGQWKFQRLQFALQRHYSPIQVLYFVLSFVVEGKILTRPVKAAAATALRDQLMKMLITRGATSAALATAAQVARKVVIAIELVIAAGCGAYCGTVTVAQTMAALTVGLAQVIAATTKVLESTGGIVGGLASLAGEALARPVLLAWSMLDVENWDVAHLPPAAGPDMLAAGEFFSSEAQGETLAELMNSLARPIIDYPPDVADLVWQVVSVISEERTDLGEDPLPLTPQQALRLAPFEFVKMLHDEAYLDFVQDPEALVDFFLGGETEGIESE
jgi:Domain of unknown function (DUF4157)